jgi:nucleoside-diphosphate-sugar epimerase
MKVLVTGGGGFLGQAIVKQLLDRGDSVRSLTRHSYRALEELGVEQFLGSLVDAELVAEAAAGCDLVFHVAAKAGVWGPYDEYYQTNVVGTRNVIAACRKNHILKLVYTSSPSVVFDGNDMEGVDESVPYPQHYHAFYPQTKAAAERLVLASNDAGLATVALRPHLIWGPGDNHLVPRIIERGRRGALRRIGDKPCVVDTTYIDNAAAAHLLAAAHLAPGAACVGRAYFIANDEPIPLWEMVNRILAAGGVGPVKRSVSPRLAYAAGWTLEKLYGLLHLKSEPSLTRFTAREMSTAHWFDLSAAKTDLGYQPQVSIDEGLSRLAIWLEGED